MPFDLSITFTGLCFFAYDRNSYHVLMPDSDPPISNQIVARGNTPIPYAEPGHAGHPSEQPGPSDPSGTAAGDPSSGHQGKHEHHHKPLVWYNAGYHDGRELGKQYIVTDLEDRFLVLDKARAGTNALPPEIIDLKNELGYGSVPSRLTSGASMPDALDARVTLNGGTLTPGTTALFAIEKKHTADKVEKPLTFQATWRVPDYPENLLVLDFKERNNGLALSATLRPVNDAIHLHVTCLPAMDMLHDRIADHFAYYGVVVDDGKHLPRIKRPKFAGKLLGADVEWIADNQVRKILGLSAVTCMVAGGPVG